MRDFERYTSDTAVRFNMIADDYRVMARRASYYAWAARKNAPLVGGDPITGRKNDDRVAGLLVNKTLARHYFERAAAIRNAMKVKVLP